jgi:hypothetical protein
MGGTGSTNVRRKWGLPIGTNGQWEIAMASDTPWRDVAVLMNVLKDGGPRSAWDPRRFMRVSYVDFDVDYKSMLVRAITGGGRSSARSMVRYMLKQLDGAMHIVNTATADQLSAFEYDWEQDRESMLQSGWGHKPQVILMLAGDAGEIIAGTSKVVGLSVQQVKQQLKIEDASNA